MLKKLEEVQVSVGAWSKKNFGEQQSKVTGERLGSLAPLLGAVEEMGELCHAVLKHHQGIRGFDDQEKYENARDDALADILVYLCDFAEREGADLMQCLSLTWDKVQLRDWLKNREAPPEELA